MKKLLLGTASLMIAAAAPMTAQAGDISVSTSIDLVSDYVFRGVSLADTAIQPGVSVTVGNFTAGAWYSTGAGNTSIAAADELDLYASYGFNLSNKVSASIGGTYYHYPQSGGLFETNGGNAGTYEVSAGVVLSPSATAYYDFTLEAFTLEGGVSHSVTVSDKTNLNLGLTAGLVDGQNISWEYGTLSAAYNYGFTDNVSTYIGANYTLTTSDDVGLGLDFEDALFGNGQSDLLWVGAGISAGF